MHYLRLSNHGGGLLHDSEYNDDSFAFNKGNLNGRIQTACEFDFSVAGSFWLCSKPSEVT
jgi:hypothetical protein